MRVRVPVRRRVRIEMLPLIDIVFLLLVFFIYAMLSMAVHRGLPVLLPESSTAEIEKRLLISVTIRKDGGIYLDREQTSLDRLRQDLERRAPGLQEKGVVLFADRDIPYRALFRVLDEIRKAGFTRISLQAEADRSP